MNKNMEMLAIVEQKREEALVHLTEAKGAAMCIRDHAHEMQAMADAIEDAAASIEEVLFRKDHKFAGGFFHGAGAGDVDAMLQARIEAGFVTIEGAPAADAAPAVAPAPPQAPLASSPSSEGAPAPAADAAPAVAPAPPQAPLASSPSSGLGDYLRGKAQ